MPVTNPATSTTNPRSSSFAILTFLSHSASSSFRFLRASARSFSCRLRSSSASRLACAAAFVPLIPIAPLAAEVRDCAPAEAYPMTWPIADTTNGWAAGVASPYGRRLAEVVGWSQPGTRLRRFERLIDGL